MLIPETGGTRALIVNGDLDQQRRVIAWDDETGAALIADQQGHLVEARAQKGFVRLVGIDHRPNAIAQLIPGDGTYIQRSLSENEIDPVLAWGLTYEGAVVAVVADCEGSVVIEDRPTVLMVQDENRTLRIDRQIYGVESNENRVAPVKEKPPL